MKRGAAIFTGVLFLAITAGVGVTLLYVRTHDQLYKQVQKRAAGYYTRPGDPVASVGCTPHVSGLTVGDHTFHCLVSYQAAPARAVVITTHDRAGRTTKDGYTTEFTFVTPSDPDDSGSSPSPPVTSTPPDPGPDYGALPKLLGQLRQSGRARAGVRLLSVFSGELAVEYATRPHGPSSRLMWNESTHSAAPDANPFSTASDVAFPLRAIDVRWLAASARRIAQREHSRMLPGLTLHDVDGVIRADFHLDKPGGGTADYEGPVDGRLTKD